eukprot:1513312-Rhodomonas_salina.1
MVVCGMEPESDGGGRQIVVMSKGEFDARDSRLQYAQVRMLLGPLPYCGIVRCYGVCSTERAYGAMPCGVLAQRMVLCGAVCYRSVRCYASVRGHTQRNLLTMLSTQAELGRSEEVVRGLRAQLASLSSHLGARKLDLHARSASVRGGGGGGGGGVVDATAASDAATLSR